MATRRGRESAFGRRYSLISIVFGSIFARPLILNCTNQGVPLESKTIPYGLVRGVGGLTSLISLVLGSSLPTMFAAWSVNHRMPLRSISGVWGSRAAGSGILYSVTSPVFGLSLPTSAAVFPVYQILPSLSAVNPCGPLLGVFNGYSFIIPVLGSRRPRTLAHIPVHQIAPSEVASGSCGREPSEGTTHSLIVTFTSPGMITALGFGFSGKFFPR